jgi:cysteine synthase A
MGRAAPARRGARAHRAAGTADRREGADRRAARLPLSDDRRAQGAAGLCLPRAQRLVTGRFDPAEHKAIWPSTGNYCRGGVAISRILGCRGVAVLPEGMSRERFDWLEKWVPIPPTSSARPARRATSRKSTTNAPSSRSDRENVILNQFSEFANYMAHYTCTGAAFERVFSHLKGDAAAASPRRFVSATGSAGTLAAATI